MQHIEDKVTPETAIEIALINRIRELRIMLYERGNYDMVSSIPREIDVPMPTAPLTLHLAASVTSEMENEQLIITGRTRGLDECTFGIHSYVTRDVLLNRRPDGAIRYLETLHRDVTQRLAKLLSEPRT